MDETRLDRSDRLLGEGIRQRVRGHIREGWGALTDQEVEQARGNWDQVVGTIEEKTGEGPVTRGAHPDRSIG